MASIPLQQFLKEIMFVFARELKDEEGKLAEEKIISQEEFKKMIELEGWKKEQDEEEEEE